MRAKEWIPENDKTEEMKAEEQKIPFFATQKGRAVSALIMFVILAVVLALSLSGKSGAITFQMDDNMLGIVYADQNPVFIAYEDIDQVELITSFDMGQAVQAADWDSGWCGVYENGEYGTYTLFAYSSVGEYIAVHHTGGVLIFNLKKAKTTEKTFQELLERCSLLTQ